MQLEFENWNLISLCGDALLCASTMYREGIIIKNKFQTPITIWVGIWNLKIGILIYQFAWRETKLLFETSAEIQRIIKTN